MGTNFRRIAVMLSLAFTTAACGTDGIPFSDLEDTQLDQLCDRAVACGDFPDKASCLAANTSGGFDDLEADIEDGLVTYDAEQAAACLDALAATPACSLIFDDPSIENAEEVCEGVFAGTVPLDGDCVRNVQCSGDLVCQEPDSCTEECCVGTCVEDTSPPDAAIGDSCLEANCVSGAYCNPEDMCAAYVAVGQVCDDLFGCVSGAFCDYDFSTGMGTCIDLADRGEDCDPEAIFSCLHFDDYCDPTSMTCTARGGVGDTCDVELGNCLDLAYCDAGTCAANAGAGDTCVVDGNPECLGELECTGGSCVLPEPDPVCTL